MKRTTLKLLLPAGCVGMIALLYCGCASITQVGVDSGVITADQGKSIVKTGEAFGKAVEQITPEQEYYVGRAVGATVVSTYRVYNNDTATHYINVIGQALALASSKPETFGGYHFLILDSDEINAFAAPGGLIFVSRGMLRLCHSEDQLAGVLAHEVAHVNLSHAIAAISNSRWTQAFTTLGTEGAKNMGGEQLSQLTGAFEGSINDITQTMMTSGYGRKQEKQADGQAIKYMQRLGYDPNGLVQVLTNMGSHLKPGGHDFAATHPPPAARIADLKAAIGSAASTAAPAVRQQRFSKAMSGV